MRRVGCQSNIAFSHEKGLLLSYFCNKNAALMKDQTKAPKIEKRIVLKAPIARVWHAVADYRQFGEWFQVKLEGPFEPGKPARGHLTYPGYENLKFEFVVQKMEPEILFSFTWHPTPLIPRKTIRRKPPPLWNFGLRRSRWVHCSRP